MDRPALLFVPLDDRPVSCDLVVELAEAAGVEVRAPDRAYLGDRDRPGAVRAIWHWLEDQAARGASAAIVSAEMLCFGGLVASRRSEAAYETVAPLAARLVDLGGRLPLYVSAVIPRTPVAATDEDAPYWRTYGEALRRASAALHPEAGAPDEAAVEEALREAGIPEPVRAAVSRQRGRHLRINAGLLASAARGAFRYALVGQDDTAPGSLSEAEREALQAGLPAEAAARAMLTSGADELNARLLARWLGDLTGRRPTVRVIYTFPGNARAVPLYEARPLAETLAEHLRSAGCAPAGDDPDIVLWVHNFEDRQREAAHQEDDAHVLDAAAPVVRLLRAAVREERVAALADVRFANGADRTLVRRLLDEPRFAGIVAYAGWNTCSNTLGTALAQAVVAFHLRAGTLPGNDRRYRPALVRRLLDDWGYQAVVRPRLRAWLEQRGADPSALGAHEAEAEQAALERLRAEALPAVQRSFAHHPLSLQQATFPWHRLFEVRLGLEAPAAVRPSAGVAIADYDPAWPRRYEEERAAIARALGGMVRGIEHVGSTAVPGLAAKPVIDIMAGVAADDLDRAIEPLRAIGYEYNPDWEISMPLRRYFRRRLPDGTHTHHLHVVPHGGEFWTRHLRFRDYLRAHPGKAKEYEELKRRLAREHRTTLEYTHAKTAFIRSVEALAGVIHR